MDPISSILGIGSSLAGGIMGADAADTAANTNWMINQDNFMLTEQERQQEIQAAYQAAQQRQQEMQQQQMGSTDSEGNHTYFDPSRGWVTDLSAQGRQAQDEANQLRDAQSQERLQELTKDVPLERAQMQRSFDQNASAGDQAAAFSQMLHNAILEGPQKNLGNVLYASQAQGINDAYDKEQAEATRTAVRQGTNGGDDLAALARARGKDLSAASVQDMMQGRQQALQEYNDKIGNLTQLLGAFTNASRANLGAPSFNPADTDYNPTSVGQAQAQVGANSQLQANDGSAGILSAINKSGGQMDYVQPNYGEANTFATLGGQLMNMARPQTGSSSGNYTGLTSGLGSAFSGIGSGFNNLTNSFMGNSGVF